MSQEDVSKIQQESPAAPQSKGDSTEQRRHESLEEDVAQMRVARQIMLRYADTLKRLADS